MFVSSLLNANTSRSRVVSRPATPAPRLLPQQYSDHEISDTPVAAGNREYYDEAPPVHRVRHASTSLTLNQRNPYRQVRTSSRPRRDYSYGPYGTTEEEHYYYDPATERMPRGRIRGGGGRSKSRSRSQVSIDEGAFHPCFGNADS